MFYISGLSLKKTPHMWLPHAKTTFCCYGNWGAILNWAAYHNIVVCDKHEIKYWYKNNRIRLNNDTESRKYQHVSKLIELMFKGESHCLQGCFRKQRTFKLV